MFRIIALLTTLLITAQASAAYLGLRVQDLPAHVRAQIPPSVAKNQGVIVDWLDDISPAADDGIKRYDVLLSFNGEPITSASDFMQKIQQDQAGQKRTVKLVRQGKIIELPIIMGDPPKNIKMTPPPRQARLYRPNPESARKASARGNIAKLPTARVPLNIAGKPAFPMRKKPEVHAWGTERHIWPDFYTDGTNELWDKMINAPFKMGRMPGGWRAPNLSMPDPVTIGDAVTNQMPPMAEEMGNMIDIPD